MVYLGAILLLWLGALLALLLRERLPAGPRRGWGLALFPAASFFLLLQQTIRLDTGADQWAINWLSSPDFNFSIYFDPLAALFALLVTGIGSLIIIYAGYYFAGDTGAWRFLAYLFLFMGMMLGLVMAGDLVTLFIFWEGTSITSFLLVAYKYNYDSARRGAFKALFITGGGGIALLAGFLFLSHISGSSDLATILVSGATIRASELYLVALMLIAFGAFTKSAQAPAHIWLPEAMSAPTPASAFLHSATMVKAGIYLLARLNPALGNTEAWFWLLSLTGLLTMVTGAYLGTKQKDLKALLAYSTIAQLGILMMLIGQDTEIAFKALVIGIVAHAFYKSALFMAAGAVDLATGTRDLARLGGLRKQLPLTFAVVLLAGLSLAGLPPLFGFLAKETLLATAVHPSLPLAVSWLFTALIVLAAAFKLVQAGLVVLDGFTGQSRDSNLKVQPLPQGMLLAPLLPALMSLALGLLPEPKPIAEFLGAAAAASYGDKVKVSFALWTGLNIPVLLSLLAIGLGTLLFWKRRQLIAWQEKRPAYSFNQLFAGVQTAMARGGWVATRLQNGHLRRYLSIMIIAMLLLVLYTSSQLWPSLSLHASQPDPLRLEFDLIRILTLVATVGAALATLFIKRDFFAVLALGAAGLGVAVYMAVEPAPDVALVQIVVDILATVILVLALSRLPRAQREAAQQLNQGWQVRNILVAAGAGILMTVLSYQALISRPRASLVTPFYRETANSLTGASDIVGAIIVDFRALDTLIEIVVFSLAGLGIYTLLQFAARYHDDHGQAIDSPAKPMPGSWTSLGISGPRASSYVQVITNLLLPAALMIAAVHIIYGHDQPGDGFTAGVIISLAIGLKYVVFGFRETRRRLPWLRPRQFIAGGVLLVLVNGVYAALSQGYFLAPVDYGALLGLPLPAGVKLSSGFLFELAIALTVLGGVSLMLDTLGRPAVDTDRQRSAQAESQPVPQAGGD